VLKRNGEPVNEQPTRYTYTAVGSRATVTLPNGTVTTYQYDDLNRLRDLQHWAETDTTLLASYQYELHPTGRRSGATESLRNEDNSNYLTRELVWEYDKQYRLRFETSTSSASELAFSTEYQYDKVGNRKKKITAAETIDYSYNENDQLTGEESNVHGTTTYGYDANGSLTSKTTSAGTIAYAYNLANKLSGVTAGASTTTYLYNDSGIRVQSTTGSSVRKYLVDEKKRGQR
jgi:YD repeat-containing protein